MLQSEEAARRLGVKVSTLYAYVSRGLLTSHPETSGRRSLFDLSEIERLANRGRGGRQVESKLATITTGVTQLRQDGPFYRGRAATELASDLSFEAVAELLWETAEGRDGGEASEPGGAEADWSSPELGHCPLVHTSDRMRWALIMCGANDPLRSDLRPAAVARAARRIIAALTASVGSGGSAGGTVAAGDGSPPIASRLARRLTGGMERGGADGGGGDAEGTSLSSAAVNAALVLMADHELATSTVAVRMAASTRADLYDALLAGLATMAGPLHGGASQRAYELLASVERDGASRALNDVLRWHNRLPGFGHMIYRERDPRFDALWALAAPLLSEERRALFGEVIELAAAHDVPVPNCDLALAALSWGTGMPPDAGQTIFTVARLAGWTAHYQEELTERPLRFRARAVYSV
jgi:citrate synthase